MLSVRQYSAYGSQLSDDSDAYDADEAYVDDDGTASYSTEWYASSESIVVVSIIVDVNATELAAGGSSRSSSSDDDDDGYCRRREDADCVRKDDGSEGSGDDNGGRYDGATRQRGVERCQR